MPTKKRPAKKTAVKSVASKPKTTEKTDHALKLVAILLYIWTAVLAVMFAFLVAGLIQTPANTEVALPLSSLLSASIIFITGFITLKTARAILGGSDDGYLSGIVVFMNVVIFGIAGFSIQDPLKLFFPFAYAFIVLGIMGLMFLLPAKNSFYRVTSHVLTTWSIVLFILYWFVQMILNPIIANSI